MRTSPNRHLQESLLAGSNEPSPSQRRPHLLSQDVSNEPARYWPAGQTEAEPTPPEARPYLSRPSDSFLRTNGGDSGIQSEMQSQPNYDDHHLPTQSSSLVVGVKANDMCQTTLAFHDHHHPRGEAQDYKFKLKMEIEQTQDGNETETIRDHEGQARRDEYDNQKRRRLCLQVLMYALSYGLWVTVHIQREFWAMSKKAMHQNEKEQMEQDPAHKEVMTMSFFGSLDTSLFFSYSLFQFFSGSLGDRFDKRKVLSISYSIQAVAYLFLGMAGTFGLQSKFFFHLCFIAIGTSQSMVFPCLVSVVGAWFSRRTRGVITGSWGTSTNIGNIIGIQISAVVLNLFNNQWQVLMYTITVLFFINSIVILSVFKPDPKAEGIIVEREGAASPEFQSLGRQATEGEQSEIAHGSQPAEQFPTRQQGITLQEAFKIPGVLYYGFSFFCVKFSVYAFLLWLPLFLSKELQYDSTSIANMATSFEIGTMFGGVTLGYLSDKCYAKRSPVGCAAIVFASLISLVFTFTYKHMATEWIAVCFFFLGLLLGGLHHILCVTCSADLGQQQTLQNNKQATSTVTGIIDGLGSLGTAVGQFIIGMTVESYGWQYGYLLVITVVTLLTLIPLGKMLSKELREIFKERHDIKQQIQIAKSFAPS